MVLRDEREGRLLDFIDTHEEIAGIPVAPITAYRWLWLDMIRSPLVSCMRLMNPEKVDAAAEDLALFPVEMLHSFWVLTREFDSRDTPGDFKSARDAFIEKASPLMVDPEIAVEICRSLVQLVSSAFVEYEIIGSDPGTSPGGFKKGPIVSNQIAMVDAICKRYGWAEDYVVHKLPLSRGFAYLKLIEATTSPDWINVNPSDAKRWGIYQAAWNDQHATRGSLTIFPPEISQIPQFLN